jgi:hypothetical protein
MGEVQHGSGTLRDAACERERMFSEGRAVERYEQIAVRGDVLSL